MNVWSSTKEIYGKGQKVKGIRVKCKWMKEKNNGRGEEVCIHFTIWQVWLITVLSMSCGLFSTLWNLAWWEGTYEEEVDRESEAGGGREQVEGWNTKNVFG